MPYYYSYLYALFGLHRAVAKFHKQTVVFTLLAYRLALYLCTPPSFIAQYSGQFSNQPIGTYILIRILIIVIQQKYIQLHQTAALEKNQ